MGIDDDIYRTLRSHILAQDPLPPLNRVYVLGVQEESHCTMARGRDAREAVSFAVHAATHPQGTTSLQGDKPICENCGKQGHDNGSCFKLIGYPEWWGGRRGGGKNTGKGKRSFNGGHGKGSIGVANAAQAANSNTSTSHAVPVANQNQDHGSLSQVFSEEQLAMVLNMLKVMNTKPTSSEKLVGPHFKDGDWCG